MDINIIDAQREIIQGYYIKIHHEKPDVETIMKWLESDLQTIRMENTLSDAETLLQNVASKNFSLSDVSGRSELLMDFLQWCIKTGNVYFKDGWNKQMIEDYEKSINSR